MRSISTGTAGILLLAAGIQGTAVAADYTLVIENHRFQSDILSVPAEQRVKLVIENRDATPEEFESRDLRREKMIPGNSTASLWIGPLPAGEYEFVGEFHEDTAKGKLIAK